jgi:hypothetical protein
MPGVFPKYLTTYQTTFSVRPPLPNDLRGLVRRMAREKPNMGEGRIADELSLK